MTFNFNFSVRPLFEIVRVPVFALVFTGALFTTIELARADEKEDIVKSVAFVRDSFEKLLEATQEKNIEKVMINFTADASVFDPAFPPGKFNGYDEIRSWHMQMFEDLSDISISTTNVQTRDAGDVIWLTCEYVFKAIIENEAKRGDGFLSLIWTLQPDKTYKIELFHASNLPKKP